MANEHENMYAVFGLVLILWMVAQGVAVALLARKKKKGNQENVP